MKSKSRMIWGISLLLIAIALVLFAFKPDISFVNISLWKIIIAIVLLAWIIERLFFSSKLQDRFDVFIPIGISLLIFEKEIASALGKSSNLYSGWLAIVGSVLLTTALHIIFPEKKVNNPPENYQTNANAQNHFSTRTVYLDATAKYKLFANNSFGTTKVYFNNTEAADETVDLDLIITNKFGSVEVFVPKDWFVECKNDNSFAQTKCRENSVGGKKLNVLGSCSFGSIELK